MADDLLHNEKDLLTRIADGDEEAFALIYHHYYPLLYPFVSKLTNSPPDTIEILQETFIRVWLARDKLPAIDNFRAWIFKVSSRENLTYLKNALHHQEKLNRYGSQYREVRHADTPDELLHSTAIARLVREAVYNMPQQRRQIYQMSRDRGMKPNEIAETLSISKNTVHNVLSTALREIREHLKASGYSIPLLLHIWLKIF